MDNFFLNFKKSFSHVYKNAKGAFYITIIQAIVNASQVYVLAYINRLILNRLSIALNLEPNWQDVLVPIVEVVILNWLIVLLYSAVGKIFQYYMAKSTLKYNIIATQQLYTKLANMDISYFDNPQENNHVKQAYQDMVGYFSLFQSAVGLFLAFFSFVLSFVIIVRFNPLLTVLVLVSLIPSFFLKRYIRKSNYDLERSLNGLNRRVDYLGGIFQGQHSAQDLRLYPSFFRMAMNKYVFYSEKRNSEKMALQRKNSLWEVGYAILYGLLNVLINIYILFTIIKKTLAIGDLSYYTTITGNLGKNVESCFTSISELALSNARVTNYRLFLEKKPEVDREGTDPVADLSVHTFEFHDVTFRYPNTDKDVLRCVSFSFSSNQKIAFAGLIGCVKTTLIKLLLRFYDPTSGEIYLDGKNIKEYDVVSYRNLFSAMFQNFANYSFTVEENVTLSDENVDRKKVLDILEQFGMSHISLDAEYSKTFSEDGLIFSKGQAQLFNMMRAFYCDASVYIFDEPSASMDAKAEAAIVDHLFDHVLEKGFVFISHRLSNLKNMDQIVYLENGQILESGTHEQLINNGGEYSKLYYSQLKRYI